jgi:hypothetical protein
MPRAISGWSRLMAKVDFRDRLLVVAVLQNVADNADDLGDEPVVRAPEQIVDLPADDRLAAQVLVDEAIVDQHRARLRDGIGGLEQASRPKPQSQRFGVPRCHSVGDGTRERIRRLRPRIGNR